MDPITATATAAIETAATGSLFAGYMHMVIGVICIVCGALVCAISQCRVITQTADCIARQPEAAKELRNAMIVGLAMIESIAIYCLLISIIIVLK